MFFIKDRVLMSTLNASEKLAAEGRIYDAFTLMNKYVMKNFTRLGVIQAAIYFFDIVDDCSINTSIFFKNSFIKTTYEDVNRMTFLVNNKSQMHFWAGCIKICQYRNDHHHSIFVNMQSLKTARQHFLYTMRFKPEHVLAQYLLTMVDNAYFDLTGTIPFNDCIMKKPKEFYKHVIIQEPEYFLAFSFILGKLGFYLREHYFAECYLNMTLCRIPKTPLDNHLSHKSLKALNLIAELKTKQYY